jgi:Mitochondrial genome maintenance MGM101.
MSALRCRPWRALETLQYARATAQDPRARMTSHLLSNSITKRAISSSSTRPQNSQASAAKPAPPAQATRTTAPVPAATATRVPAATPNPTTTENLSKSGLSDQPRELENATEDKIDWTRSFHGLSATPFPKEAADILMAETDPEEVEIKPDGILYLPEIKYRRILNKAFGPGGWGLAPRGESIVTPKTVTREYALVCHGR